MSQVRTSQCGTVYFDAGQVVWDDYVNHRQLALTADSWEILGWFRDWKPLHSIRDAPLAASSGTPELVARQLVEAGLLVERGSVTAKEQEAITAAWGTWGAPARYFYYSTRTTSRTPADGDDATAGWFRANAPFAPSPGFFNPPAEPDGALRLPPGPSELDSDEVLRAISQRRSCRFYDPAAHIGLPDLSCLLRTCFGVSSVAKRPEWFTEEVHKSLPSAGGRHPLEVYVAARSVTGLDPGVYRYESLSHALAPVRRVWTRADAAAATLASPWAGDAQVVLYFTAVHERTRWKYQTARALRALFLEVGHASEAVYLATQRLGLETCFVGSIRDSVLEDLLGFDGHAEVVLGSSTVGVAASNWQERSEREGPSPRAPTTGGDHV